VEHKLCNAVTQFNEEIRSFGINEPTFTSNVPINHATTLSE